MGGTRSSGHKDYDVERGRRRADRSGRSEDGADVPRASPIRLRWTTGIRHSRWTCAGFAKSTNSTGEVSNHTEGVRRAADRATALADTIRIGDRDSCPTGDGQSLVVEARDVLVERLRATADPLALGPQSSMCALRVSRPHAERRTSGVLRLLQLLHRRLALLLVALFFKLESNSACEGGLSGGRLRSGAGAQTVPAGRYLARRRRKRARHRRCAGLCVADDVRAAIVVGRCGRDDALTLHVSPASLVGGAIGGVVAGGWLHLVDAASVESHLRRSLLMGTLDNSQLSTPNSQCRLEGSGRLRRRRLPCLQCSSWQVRRGSVERVGAFFGAGSALLLARCARRPGCSGVARAAESRVTAGSRCRGWGCERRPIVPAAACYPSPSSHLRRSF